MTTVARSVETMRQLGEDAVLELLQLTPAPAPAAAPDVPAIQGRVLRMVRQMVLDAGETVLKLRMAAEDGAALANQAWSPVAGYDELPDNIAKAYKELKKDKEKEAKAAVAQQAQRGGGGPTRGYYRGRGYHYQPYVVPQTYTAQQQLPAAMGAPPPGYAAQQQQMWPGQTAPGQQYGYQQVLWPPDGYMHGGFRGRGGLRPDVRSVAKCYGCGVLGHFNKDNVCLPGAREAYQALQASMQLGQAGQQLAIQGPPGTGGN